MSATGGEEPRLQERHDVVQRMQRWLGVSQQADEHEVDVLGARFVVLPQVFSPLYYSETEFYAEHILREIGKGTRFLDMGCGVGVNAVLAAKRGASVVACDVNPQAVENTRCNAARHGVQVDVRESDIFTAVRADERFDLVYWNIPFAFREPDVELSPLEEAIFDPGFRKHLTFLAEVRQHLEPSALLLVGASSSLGDLPAVEAAGLAQGFRFELRATAIEKGSDPPNQLDLLAARA